MNVTYLLGAGASIGAIPILNKLPESICKFINEISKRDLRLQDYEFGYKIAPFKTQQKLITDLCWIVEETDSKRTIDQLAKYLFDNEEFEKLNRLKLALTVYFICQQLQNPYDCRYQVFLESILKRPDNSFPNNVKILTWNYDFQLEKCFGTMTRNYRLHDNTKTLNVASKYANLADFDENRFGVVKLNGTTNIIKLDEKKDYVFIDSVEREFEVNTLERVLYHYANGLYNRSEYYPGISFAWEKQEGENEILNAAKRTTAETEVLVVIGYSFPDVNVEIDREIIENMTSLKEIYYQVPEAEEGIKEMKRKLCLKYIEVYPMSCTDCFLIPFLS
jgi:hypothetical protein